jgi:hypothetical protein
MVGVGDRTIEVETTGASGITSDEGETEVCGVVGVNSAKPEGAVATMFTSATSVARAARKCLFNQSPPPKKLPF